MANGLTADLIESSACQTTQKLTALPLICGSRRDPKMTFLKKTLSSVSPKENKTQHSKENYYLNSYHIHVLPIKKLKTIYFLKVIYLSGYSKCTYV